MDKEKVAVAILNYNGKHWLEKFLPNVLEHSRSHAQVYVIDNASTDDSVDLLNRSFPDVRQILNTENEGYTGGYNAGMAQLDEEIVVLLNSDVEVSENWLQPILDAFEGDEQLAAVQPKILDHKKRDRFEYAGGAGGFIDVLGYPFCRGRIFQELEEDHGQYDDTQPIFWASGACLAVRRSFFLAAGQLDPIFFAHFEEIDLCWRFHRMGHRVGYVSSSVVYHVGGGTLSNLNPRKTYLNFRNNLFVLFKNLPGAQLSPVILKRMLLDGAAGVLFLLQGKPRHTWAVVQAHGSFYRRWSELRERRKAMEHLPAEWPLGQVYKGSVSADFFIRGRRRFSELPATDFHSRP